MSQRAPLTWLEFRVTGTATAGCLPSWDFLSAVVALHFIIGVLPAAAGAIYLVPSFGFGGHLQVFLPECSCHLRCDWCRCPHLSPRSSKPKDRVVEQN